MAMMTPLEQHQQMIKNQQAQQMMQSQQDMATGKAIGGLVANALAKRNDGINDSIGNGVRYTNDGSKGAFNKDQISALQQFAGNGMDTSQAYGGLANQKFTIGGNQYQADKDGLLTMIPQQEQAPVVSAGLTTGIPVGASSIGLDTSANDLFKAGKNAITFD